MTNPLNIFIVDDHEIFRNGLKMVINRLKYARVIAEASNGKEFLDTIEHLNVDIVFMDIEMPVMNGIEATKKALKKIPDLKIVALTMFNDDEYVQSMIDAGVMGFLLKNISKEIIDKAIRTVAQGNNYYSEELWNFFTKKISQPEKTVSQKLQLTKREKEILQLFCEGKDNKEIAEKLFVSERTIIGHKSNLLSKTGCKNTISLISYAIRNGLVSIQ